MKMNPFRPVAVTVSACVLSLGAFFLPNEASALTYYVSTTGSAAWPSCTAINTPCSATTALANANPEDIIYFMAGTYEPGASSNPSDVPAWNPANSGTPGRPILFKAYPGETVTINDSTNGAAIGASQRDYIIWDGFRLDRDKDTGTGASSIVKIYLSNNITIRNCDIIGRPHTDTSNGSLITIAGGATNILIHNNKLHGITDGTSASVTPVNTAAVWVMDADYVDVYNNDIYDTVGGVYMKVYPDYVNVYKNHIYNCSAAAVKVHPQGALNTDFNIYQNVVRNCAVFVEATDAEATEYRNLKVYGNTVYNSGAATGVVIGSFSKQNSRNAEVYNNIFQFGGTGSVFLQYYSGASFPAYSGNNVFYGEGKWGLGYQTYYTTLSSWQSVSGADADSSTGNPLLMNTAGSSPRDLMLSDTSPAKKAGRNGEDIGAFVKGFGTRIGYQPVTRPDKASNLH